MLPVMNNVQEGSLQTTYFKSQIFGDTEMTLASTAEDKSNQVKTSICFYCFYQPTFQQMPCYLLYFQHQPYISSAVNCLFLALHYLFSH